MVPEESHEVFSDDEISIDVPSVSSIQQEYGQSTTTIANTSFTSIQQDFASTRSIAGSIYSEKERDENDDDDDDDEEEEESNSSNSSIQQDFASTKSIAGSFRLSNIDKEIVPSESNESDSDSEQEQKKIDEQMEKERPMSNSSVKAQEDVSLPQSELGNSGEVLKVNGCKDKNSSHKGEGHSRKKTMSESSNMTTSTLSLTKCRSDSESSVKESDTEDERHFSREDDEISDSGNENDVTDSDLDEDGNKNNHDEDEQINRSLSDDSCSDDHSKDIQIDDPDLEDERRLAGSDHECLVDLKTEKQDKNGFKVTKDEPLNSSGKYSSARSTGPVKYSNQNVNDNKDKRILSSDYKNSRSKNTARNKTDTLSSVTPFSHEAQNENVNGAHIKESERGVSVSNILLDSSTSPPTPTEGPLGTDRLKTEIEHSRLVSPEIREPVPETLDENKFKTDTRPCALSLTQKMPHQDHISDSDLSPISDVEYDYQRRRGSYLKIKLEGRKRQRLSISEGEQSPTEPNHFEIDVVDRSPLLDKRKKMDKVSLLHDFEKSPARSPTTVTPTNQVIDIHDTVGKSGRSSPYNVENTGNKTNTSLFTKSPQHNTVKNINTDRGKNINTFNAEILAIYNSSVTEQIETPSKKRNTENADNTTSLSHQSKEEEYFEGYHLLKSCNQILATQDSVTDINQLIVKTHNQSTSGTCSPRQDLNSDNISNNQDTTHKDSKNIVETKSLLLPKHNETGNYQIKDSKKSAIEHDRFTRNCEHRQLFLRQNGDKNNDNNEPNHSSERSPSYAKQNKHKTLSKAPTYEDLHDRKILGASFSRSQPEINETSPTHFTKTNKCQRERTSCARPKFTSSSTELEFKGNSGVKTAVASTEKRVKQNKNIDKKELEKNLTTGEENSKMSARMFRSRDTMPEYSNIDMAGRLHRTQSALTDTARLRDIRKLLKLPDDNEVKQETGLESNQGTVLIIQDIIDGIINNVCNHRRNKRQTAMKTHRCTTTDDQGMEILCCLLQTSSNEIDPSLFTCDVIDPVNVTPITRKHENLVSDVIRISSYVTTQFNQEEELFVSIPVCHWYVEPWQELIVRQQYGSGIWKDTTEQPAEVVKIDDTGRVYYGVRHLLAGECYLAVISRPRKTTVTVSDHDQVVHAAADDRVKMHVFSSDERKSVSMQVVPVPQSVLARFSETDSNKGACVIVASSPLIQVNVSDNETESMAFEVPYVCVSPTRHGAKSPITGSNSSYLRTSDDRSLLSPYLSPTQSPRHSRSPRRLSDAAPKGDNHHQAFHLAQIDDSDEVKVKLLGGNDQKSIDVVTRQLEEPTESGEPTVKFSVYDKSARVIAIQTRGSLEYSDVEMVTKSYVNYIVKHKVTLRVSQDPRNVYSILFTALVDHPHQEEDFNFKQTYKHFTTTYRKLLHIHEGDVVAISFRGNVDVPEREKLIYSFHGYRGIRRHFDIQVSNPMSQRSLQTYHGALQLFTLKGPRYSGLDRSLVPCVKNGWELSAEFPLLLPKYLKTTPVIINKAPVCLRFHEPLTVDFVRMICSELVNDWTQFAKALGISHARVQAIKQQHRNQVSDRVLMDVIINWMKTQRISQDKVSPLISALRLCNRPKLASELAHRYSAQRVSRSKTTRDKSLQRAFSLLGKSSSVSARWRQLLYHLCQKEGSHVIDVTKEIDDKFNDEVTRCQYALNHWKTTTAAPSVWSLVDALRATRCDIVADTIVSMESKRK